MSIQLNRIYKEGIADLRELFKKTPVLSEHNPFEHGSVEEFEWQFFSDSYEPSVYIVASDTDKNELAGTLAAIIIPMVDPHGKICKTIKPEDTLVNIRSLIRNKNRDILQEMYDLIIQETKNMDIKFLWGFTKEVGVYNRLGFANCFSSQQGVYIINLFSAYEHLVGLNKSNKAKQKIQILALTLLSYGIARFKARKVKNIHCREVQLEEIDHKSMLSFLPKGLYSLHLDEYFLEWRIKMNPSELKYSVLQFSDVNNKIISYLVFSKKNNTIYFIEQVLFDQSLTMVEKKKVVHAAMMFLKQQGAAIVRAMGFKHNRINKEEIEIFNSVGFTFVKKGIPFVFKTNDETIKPEHVYLSRLNTQGTF